MRGQQKNYEENALGRGNGRSQDWPSNRTSGVKRSMTSTESINYRLLLAVAGAHMLNDLLQALLPSCYPLLKSQHHLSYTELGLISFAFHLTGSLCQPLVGWLGDRKSLARCLPLAMVASGIGLLLLLNGASFAVLFTAAALIGIGSAIFHPEASRLTRSASAGRFGLAQSIFQLGGNLGSALGPLLVSLWIIPLGLVQATWLLALPVLGAAWLLFITRRRTASQRPPRAAGVAPAGGRVVGLMAILGVLLLSKYVYLAAMANYYSFYLIERFGMDMAQAQLQLFVFLAAIAVGSLLGGPLCDRLGNRPVILLSIFGSAPLTLMLPHVGETLCLLLGGLIGLLMASAFAAASALGVLADSHGIAWVFQACACLPLLGALAFLLPGDAHPLAVMAEASRRGLGLAAKPAPRG
jgi:FSR family fosmidomycin resistance protein-like MFS transporter